MLVSCLLTSNQIWQNGEIVRNLNVSEKSVDHLKKITEGAVHKDIGRISRAIATVIILGLEEDDSDASMAKMVQSTLDR